jgi:isoleucyl-tRNA synthetase
VKQIKPNFKTLGTSFRKRHGVDFQRDTGFSAEKINQLEQWNLRACCWKSITLTIEDVEISSQDIEGWLLTLME